MPRRASIFAPLERRQLFAAGFNITLQFPADLTDTAVFYQAAARWEAILLEDVPDVGPGAWGPAVDDIRIRVQAFEIDGPGGTLGYADPRYRRSDNAAALPISGNFVVDVDDYSNAGLLDIVTHEMGHLLGIGSNWNTLGLVDGYGSSNPTYNGAAGLAQYRALVGNATTPASVPVENTGALGTRDVHWRESTFSRELMTGIYNGAVLPNPLSRLSAASLIDLGYPGVNLDAAQPYNLPNSTLNRIPTVTSLTANASGGTLTLTANGVADTAGSAGGAAGVANVRFYRETSGVAGLQASGNVLVKDALVTLDNAGPDWATSISISSLSPGTNTFYAQVTDAAGAVSAIVTVTYVIAPTPTTPIVLGLAAASDTGASTTDGVTNDATPTVLGTAGANATVRVFADGVEIGQTTADGGGNWTLTPTATLADGGRTITAQAQEGSGTSAMSAAYAVTIDTVAPQATSATFGYLTSLGVTFAFNKDVGTSLADADATFLNTTTGQTFTARLAFNGGTTARYEFAAFPDVPRGVYAATLQPAGVADLAGNALAAASTLTFTYLPGDVDRNGSVTFADLLAVAAKYGQAATRAQGDLDYNGTVGFTDLLMVGRNYGASLVTTAANRTTPTTRRDGANAARVGL